jgi:hypothetical protein
MLFDAVTVEARAVSGAEPIVAAALKTRLIEIRRTVASIVHCSVNATKRQGVASRSNRRLCFGF